MAGDLLLTHVIAGQFLTGTTRSISAPAGSGWVKLQQVNAPGPYVVALFWKRAMAGDPANWAFSIDGGETCRWHGLMQAIQSAGDPESSAQRWDAAPAFKNATTTPASTTTIANSVDFRFPARATNQVYSALAPWSSFRPGSGSINHAIASFWQTRASAGTYGTQVFTCVTANNNQDGGFSVVVPPDGATPSVRASSSANQDASETASLTIAKPTGTVEGSAFVPQIIHL